MMNETIILTKKLLAFAKKEQKEAFIEKARLAKEINRKLDMLIKMEALIAIKKGVDVNEIQKIAAIGITGKRTRQYRQ